ncbi:hypothetical protein Tco_0245951 [Tanacetum coccineum]
MPELLNYSEGTMTSVIDAPDGMTLSVGAYGCILDTDNVTLVSFMASKPGSIWMHPSSSEMTWIADSLGKFDRKSDEGYLLGYSTFSKAFRVYNKRTKRVEENLHINFLKDQPNVAGTGPNWMFDLDFLTNTKMFDAPLSTDLVWSLLERKYPLSANVCQTMLKMKLLDGKMNEDCYKLLKMMEKQAGVRKLWSFDLDLFKLAIVLQKAKQIQDFGPTDVHVYKSIIGSLMYLTASRPDIMFAVCACARFQVTPKVSHLNAIKRIIRYLKHQPKLGLWYPMDSPFELEAFSDSDYGGASLDRKSTTGGCQFLGRRLISWQCKKQTIVANSTTEAEYVAAANCCGQVLWIQNQMMDYGFNFMNTKIHIDNESTISVIKNPVAHSRTKHIEIRFHFIRDCYEKRLIEVIKIHTDHNVADLLTKGFDVTRFNFLVDKHGFEDGQKLGCKFFLFMVFHMANLKYSDKHNMVAFLKKPNESVGFAEVVDFLKGTSLRYALTHNPTIYDSLVKQFWQTATVRTLTNGTQQLIASIDSTEYNITEASVRSKLQLADATGIHNLSVAEIYARLATLGSKSGGWDQFGSTIATALICAAMDPGNTSGNDEDSMQLKELIDIIPKLVSRIETLETELATRQRKTQKVVISELEGEEPKDQGRIIHDINDDPLVSLVRESMKMKEKSIDFVTPTKALGEAQEEDSSPTILEAAKTLSKVAPGFYQGSTGSAKIDSGTTRAKRGQREERLSMVEEISDGRTHKTKEQIKQEEARELEEAGIRSLVRRVRGRRGLDVDRADVEMCDKGDDARWHKQKWQRIVSIVTRCEEKDEESERVVCVSRKNKGTRVLKESRESVRQARGVEWSTRAVAARYSELAVLCYVQRADIAAIANH